MAHTRRCSKLNRLVVVEVVLEKAYHFGWSRRQGSREPLPGVLVQSGKNSIPNIVIVRQYERDACAFRVEVVRRSILDDMLISGDPMTKGRGAPHHPSHIRMRCEAG